MEPKKYEELAKAVSGLTEFEWNNAKSKIDYLFNQKASKLQLEREEIVKMLKQR